MRPKVSFVVLNWNNFKDTKEVVQCLERLDYPNFDIIIVDNDSKDGSARLLESCFPQYPFIRSATNSGYSGGNNLGIEYALRMKSEYVAIVNNDIVIDNDKLLDEVIAYMEESGAEILGPKIERLETRETVSVYNDSPWWNLVRKVMVKNGQARRDEAREEYNSLLLLGAFLVIKSEVFGAIGKMNEDFFMYCEENEMLLRANLHRISIAYYPQVKVLRKMGKDERNYHIRRLYYMSRNKIHMFKLHSSGWNLLFLLFINLVSDVKKIVRFLFEGKFAFAATIVKGVIDGTGHVTGINPRYH